MKKGDIILAVLIFLIAAAVFLNFKTTGQKNGSRVIISENNKTVYQGSLFESDTVTLTGNTIEIKNGSVLVVSANCKNQICANHKPITKKGESIICLPNKVYIEIE